MTLLITYVLGWLWRAGPWPVPFEINWWQEDSDLTVLEEGHAFNLSEKSSHRLKWLIKMGSRKLPRKELHCLL